MTRLLSASRLNAFQACRHQTALWLQGVKPPERADDAITLIRAKGFEHEARVVEQLRAKYGAVVEIPGEGSLEHRVQLTVQAMNDGAPVIYQAALTDGRWVGYPDFLVRSDTQEDGTWRYAPEDAKLAKKAKAEHLLQLGVYAALLEHVSGHRPPQGAIHGSGGPPERFRLEDTRHITRRMMGQFEAFIDAPVETQAVKNGACGQCDFLDRCTSEWRTADSPVFVAGMRGDQIIKLAKAGVRTLTDVAALPTGSKVPGIGEDTLAKLANQARLQMRGAAGGQHLAETLPSEPLRGFAILPPPQPGDLFYDIEGDPLYPEGLEYLHGLWGPLGDDGTDRFVALWAHDHVAEKASFERLMDLFKKHLERFPRARIYHYAPYERTALKRLSAKYATREAELDQLQRDHRFVDLYAVVRQGIRASTESYSLKDLEKIYWGKRVGEVTNAGDSIVEYERWRELSDPAILEAIERYNEDDCVSTAKLRDWLEALRPADAPFGLAVPEPDELKPEPSAKAEARAEFERDRIAVAEALRGQEGLEPELRELLAELLWFHQRSQKPQWWALFDRQTWTDEELIEDAESLGGLQLINQEPEAKSLVATYRFPEQDTKVKEGDRPRIALTLDPAGSIVKLDMERQIVVLRRQAKSGDFPERASLSPGQLIDQSVLEAGLLEVARRVSKGDFESDRALLDMLRRLSPRLAGRAQGKAVVAAGEDLVEGAIRAARDLDESSLIIQGPPGTGKTYTTARAITALLQDGKRVAVSSNSHKAINNLLKGVSKRCEDVGFELDGVKKASPGDPETVFEGYGIISVGASKDVELSHQLVGATAFEFAKHDVNSFDYLFVDEAGQVSLGNIMAMAGCARNLVLVGDQMQLPQPVQGVHPGETGLSSMDYAMQEHPTVPPERGILLNVSWRMHPDVCSFISDAVYEGRLQAEASTAVQRLVLGDGLHPALQPTGISTVDVDHQGCTQSSGEEATVIGHLIEQLLGQSWVNTAGVAAPITLSDIIVVSPFNMQVTLLKKRLPQGARIGTVDKFQGQEAPVVLVSMATSFGGDAPRGTEFLFNRNRLNVAISRAKCLAVMIKGQRLLELSSPGLADLPRLDLLARAEAAACR
ncbi:MULTISPECIES: TM0106 family RecB-like putative nuclease [unclassified Brevundimonas]|uniref:TM0106 family RecB-like putative nuclease n=1 Tax=unclassified Brevundimonas TaxID=2622653 RepID=UPI0006F1D995|nr:MULTISPECIES: TM0106 family RecB-like putative nuclease [unclassified Brevundimonas]KQY95049.1 hypothetical protein ASD25_17170 [Brevundimonas sp. Root1423]